MAPRERERSAGAADGSEREGVRSRNPRLSIYICDFGTGSLELRAGPDLPRQLELKYPPQLMVYRDGYVRMPTLVNMH